MGGARVYTRYFFASADGLYNPFLLKRLVSALRVRVSPLKENNWIVYLYLTIYIDDSKRKK